MTISFKGKKVESSEQLYFEDSGLEILSSGTGSSFAGNDVSVVLEELSPVDFFLERVVAPFFLAPSRSPVADGGATTPFGVPLLRRPILSSHSQVENLGAHIRHLRNMK